MRELLGGVAGGATLSSTVLCSRVSVGVQSYKEQKWSLADFSRNGIHQKGKSLGGLENQAR